MKRNAFTGNMSRRSFCKLCLSALAGIAVAPSIIDLLDRAGYAHGAQVKGSGFVNKREAMYYETVDATTVRCRLCPRQCVLSNGMRGFCRAREAEAGKLYTHVFGNPTAIHVDPIEKKPLYHFLPGSSSFSIATAGCNFRCKYCQNWEISQFPPEETVNYQLFPAEAVQEALRNQCATIAYTYSEPSIYYEYMLETTKLANERGIKGIYRSNGSLNKEPVEELCKHIGAANIDLKGFTQDFYSRIPEGYLDVVKENIKRFRTSNVHIEIVNLIVPTLNDDMATIRAMCRWIRDEVGKEVPLHFSRFMPTYLLRNLPQTPVRTLEEARAIALEEGLEFVYIGNVPGHEANNTYCPNDKKLLIRRDGYRVVENNIKDGSCGFCGYKIYGVWKKA